MQKFYIHSDDQQQGPFSKDELKDLKITRDTMVWFEGADNWIKAIEVEDLQEIFKSIPPPIQINTPVIPPPLKDKKPNQETNPIIEIKPKKKNTTLIIVVIAVLVVGGLGAYLYTNQQAKQAEIHQQLEEQRAKIHEQEEIEAARLADQQRQEKAANAAEKQAELENLKYERDNALTNLRAARINLEEIQKFQLLRTAAVKEQEVQDELEIIRAWENEVDRLQKEIDKY